MVGSGGATPGKLVAVTDQGFTMETRWSITHFIEYEIMF